MDYLTSWITNIVLFILLAIIVDLILPNNSMQRYTKMVIGLLLIVIILTPVLKIFNQDVDDLLSFMDLKSNQNEKQVEISIENKKKEIQASQRAYILEQMAVQMKNQVEERLDSEHGVTIQTIQLLFNGDNEEQINLQNLEKVELQVQKQVPSHSIPESIPTIQPVEINTRNPLPEKKEVKTDYSKVELFLANEWQLPEEKIEIVGGRENVADE